MDPHQPVAPADKCNLDPIHTVQNDTGYLCQPLPCMAGELPLPPHSAWCLLRAEFGWRKNQLEGLFVTQAAKFVFRSRMFCIRPFRGQVHSHSVHSAIQRPLSCPRSPAAVSLASFLILGSARPDTSGQTPSRKQFHHSSYILLPCLTLVSSYDLNPKNTLSLLRLSLHFCLFCTLTKHMQQP